ncbi:Xaa-Pro dipeptidyl-peptidase [Amycolatopsis suaedae]|nr:Xaa-Pro dipeptidyl-peptidase [Amycolatopsis suaedae]
MFRRVHPLAAALAALAVVVTAAPATAAQPRIAVEDGQTQPVFSRANAIVESVFVEAPIDSDRDGKRDRIALDIIRPAETASGLKVPAVMRASPYYGLSDDQFRQVSASGYRIPRDFADWYDDYFVPRGYAVVEVEMQGTSRSTGCATTGGPEDTASAKAAVDWLNGRAPGFTADGDPVTADWSTGNVGMIGVSYEGTLPNAVAAEGVEGLKTIVPIAAISSWYDYTRDSGIGYANGWDNRYPEWLARYVGTRMQNAVCRPVLRELGDQAADDPFDHTPFYDVRDYRPKAGNVKASVFVVHGQEDWNVKPANFSRWWTELANHQVPRKLWLHNGTHIDPISARPQEWQRQVGRWMDHWLHGIENGIMDEPMVDLERPDGTWETHPTWPAPEAKPTDLWLDSRFGEGTLGTAKPTQSFDRFTDDINQFENAMMAEPELRKPFRLAYRTDPLRQDVRISGTPSLEVEFAANRTSTPLTALLVDYGPGPRMLPTQQEPIDLYRSSCTEADIANRTGCAAPPEKVADDKPYVLVTRGSVDTKHRDGLESSKPLTPNLQYTVRWPTHPKDYVFKAGHRIGVVLVANDREYVTTDPARATVIVSHGPSRLTLPVVGTFTG